jgi:hypothetical protein
MKKIKILFIALLWAAIPFYAIADYTVTQGSGSTVFAFVCFTTKICPAHVLTNSAGTEIATSSNPVRIDPTGTTVQPVNEAQINGVTPLMGNGVTGTGSQRITISSDNSPVSGLGIGATGSAPPANGNYIATRQTGNLTGLISCDSSIVYDASTTGSTQLVALTSGQTIYICGYDITIGSTATNVKLTYGTGTACATGLTSLTPAFQIAANGGVVHASPLWGGMKTAASNALCINASAANAVQAVVYYTKF